MAIVSSSQGSLSGARQHQGAALLMAMLMVALIATMTATMVWEQWRAVQVEAAERARTQSDWLLSAALDWARLILREDARNGGPDHAGEPWAVPLAEAQLSTFLAADKNNTDVDLDAFLSGSIEDAQSRYNLRNLVNAQGALDPKELLVLQTLFDYINVSRELATLIAKSIEGAIPAEPAPEPSVAPPSTAPPIKVPEKKNLTIFPYAVEQLVWFGIPPEIINQIRPYVVVLPTSTTININTAPREVLAAAVVGMDLGTAERLTKVRLKKPFESLDQAQEELPSTLLLKPDRFDIQSRYFETKGRIRLGTQAIERRSLVRRTGSASSSRVEAVRTEFIPSHEAL